jgi:GntR family transcriptional regulator, sialic acid-inducible nan operon repressor
MQPPIREQAPIRRPKLYEEVASRVEAMIHSGRFATGDQLPSEREIMQALGVGRSAVREAMLSLQKMGLVAVRSGERARVTAPTPTVLVRELAGAARFLLMEEGGVRQFQEARMLFEIGLARLAAQRATDDDVGSLKRALERNRACMGDVAQFMRSDVEFHFAIATIARNPIFNALHDAVVEWLVEQRETSGQGPSAAEDAYAAHESIFHAIAAHDAAAAERAMEEHLQQVSDRYWEARSAAGQP